MLGIRKVVKIEVVKFWHSFYSYVCNDPHKKSIHLRWKEQRKSDLTSKQAIKFKDRICFVTKLSKGTEVLSKGSKLRTTRFRVSVKRGTTVKTITDSARAIVCQGDTTTIERDVNGLIMQNNLKKFPLVDSHFGKLRLRYNVTLII